VAKYDKALYEHQVPGGMISNLKSQLAAMHMEQRLPQILEEVAQVRRDLGYPILVSPFAQYIVTQAVLNVVQGERYKTIPDEVRKYACGYYGRLAAEPSADFLERARIKPGEIVTERAANHIEPWLPKLRQRLGPGMSDEDLLLHAFYDEALVAPLRDPAPECEESTTPLRELVKWLHDKRDIQRARIRFAGTEISFTA
jgi:pyruvate/oxaloacetate carboxyltransferase